MGKPVRRTAADIKTEKALKRRHACFNPKHAEEIQSLQDRILEMENELKIKEEQLNAEDEAVVRQEAEREELETQLNALKAENAKLLAEIEANRASLAELEQKAQNVGKMVDAKLADLEDRLKKIPEEMLQNLRKTQQCFASSHRGLDGMIRFNLTPPELIAVSKLLLAPNLPADLINIVLTEMFPMFVHSKLEEVVRKGCKNADIAIAQIKGFLSTKRKDSSAVNEIFKRTFDMPMPDVKPDPPASTETNKP